MKCTPTFASVIAAATAACLTHQAQAGLILESSHQWTELADATLPVETINTTLTGVYSNPADLQDWALPGVNWYQYRNPPVGGDNAFITPERLPMVFKRYLVFDIAQDNSENPDHHFVINFSMAFGKAFEDRDEVVPFDDWFTLTNKQITVTLGTLDETGAFAPGDIDGQFVLQGHNSESIGANEGVFHSETSFSMETLEESARERVLMTSAFYAIVYSPGTLAVEISMHDYYGEANAPEPAGLLGLGLAGAAFMQRRRRKA